MGDTVGTGVGAAVGAVVGAAVGVVVGAAVGPAVAVGVHKPHVIGHDSLISLLSHGSSQRFAASCPTQLHFLTFL